MPIKTTFLFLVFFISFSSFAYGNNLHKAQNLVEKGQHQKALQIYKNLAEEGDLQAQIQLGIMCKLGRGTSRDYVLAAKWFNVAVGKGYGEGIEYKKIMENRMTQKQITRARKLAQEWLQEHSKI